MDDVRRMKDDVARPEVRGEPASIERTGHPLQIMGQGTMVVRPVGDRAKCIKTWPRDPVRALEVDESAHVDGAVANRYPGGDDLAAGVVDVGEVGVRSCGPAGS